MASSGHGFTSAIFGIGLALTAPLGCGDDGGQGEMGCAPNTPAACQCPDGSNSTQVCLPDGSGFGFCSCGGAGTGGSGGSGTAASDGADETSGIVCGDMIQNIGECDETSDNYCPEDCPAETGDSGSSSSGGPTACDDAPVFSLLIENQSSVWSDGALNGIMAGHNLCMNMGADHVCSYAEVVAAAEAGEFAAVPAGTTAWLHRLTSATIDDITYAPGVGGRCLDWTLATNDTTDGEFVTFNAGMPVYTLDDDTNYDPAAPAPNPHVQAGLLECGGTQRAILCCHPECVP